MAGVALANSSSGYGVAKGANLLSFNVSSAADKAQFVPIFREGDIVAALQRIYAVRSTHNVASVDTSFTIKYTSAGNSLPYYSGACDSSYPALTAAINQLTSAGIAVVAASANRGFSPQAHQMQAPGCIGNTIAVSAVDKNNSDPGYGHVSSATDIFAPGGINCASTPVSGRMQVPSVNGSGTSIYTCASGTSLAAPHVAGAIALLKAESPTASVPMLLDQLLNSGSPLSVVRNGHSFTLPRLDVEAAMASPSSLPSFDVEPTGCFGSNIVSWPSASGPVTKYEVQSSLTAGFSSPSLRYSGPLTSTTLNVSSTSYMRVRACNGFICSIWKTGDEPAMYFPNCP